MRRDIELWHDADAAVPRISYEGLDLTLRVVLTIRSHLVQLRKALALDAEAFIVRKVKMQNIHLHRRHSIDVALEHIHGNVMTAHIDQQPTPGEAD